MTGISIGRYISEAINSSPEMVKLIGDKIFPLATQRDINFPFVAYQRSNLSPNYTNDGNTDDTVTVDFIVASDKYADGIDVAETLRTTLEGKRNKKYGVIDSKVLSADEIYQDDTFIQTLTFIFSINN